MDFFKTLYFLRWSANISLIDYERLSDGTAAPVEEWVRGALNGDLTDDLNNTAQRRHCTVL
ncbi:hypothetical protein [Pseudomonas sp. v388]|uniref:hypothetical protein n=1 Tax=Pseudomonas sp. v388 TaxID=2479849 RepID=UPI000F7B3FCB|nr:hypothetical protein [Pseudomonas sp. v388]